MNEDQGHEIFEHLLGLMQPPIQGILDDHEQADQTTLYDIGKACVLSSYLATRDVERTAELLKVFLIGWAAALRFGDKE